jgi:hypothetical protein
MRVNRVFLNISAKREEIMGKREISFSKNVFILANIVSMQYLILKKRIGEIIQPS